MRESVINTRRRIGALLLVFVMLAGLLTVVPLTASADEPLAGTLLEKVTVNGVAYNLYDDGTAEVTFIGDTFSQTPYTLTDVTIPPEVEVIGTGPNDGTYRVAQIGNMAFKDCSALINLNLSGNENLVNIDDSAFNGCTSLESVDLSGCLNLLTIGDHAFTACSALAEINLEGLVNLTKIADGAFYMNGSGNTRLNFDFTKLPSLETIGVEAFARHHGIINLDFGSCPNLRRLEKTRSTTATELNP